MSCFLTVVTTVLFVKVSNNEILDFLTSNLWSFNFS